MFNFIDTTEHFIFDSAKKVLSKLNTGIFKSPATAALSTPVNTALQGINQYQSVNQYDPKTIEAAKGAIKHMETRGEKDPYSFSQPSSESNKYGDALGAYQVTEARLNENSKRFLGKEVSKDEFLKNPELQDKFAESEIKFLLDRNFKMNSLFASHRGGWSDMSSKEIARIREERKDYMTKAMKKYQELLSLN
jgi:hypothetical protein